MGSSFSVADTKSVSVIVTLIPTIWIAYTAICALLSASATVANAILKPPKSFARPNATSLFTKTVESPLFASFNVSVNVSPTARLVT